MVLTTNLGVKLLDFISLMLSTLVATKLFIQMDKTMNQNKVVQEIKKHTLFLANLYNLFSVLLPPAYGWNE